MNAKHTTINIRILALLTCLLMTSMYGSMNAQDIPETNMEEERESTEEKLFSDKPVDEGDLPFESESKEAKTEYDYSPCSTCDGYARYRVLYDFNNQKICMQRRDRKNVWHDLNKRLMRPGVNQFIHFDVTNYNPLRDSLSLNYQFESLNLEGSQELIAALMRTPAPTSEEAKENGTGDEANDAQGSTGAIPVALADGQKNAKFVMPLIPITYTYFIDSLTNTFTTLEAEWTKVPKDKLDESDAYNSFLEKYNNSMFSDLGNPGEAKLSSSSQITAIYAITPSAQEFSDIQDTLIHISSTFDKITAYQAAYELTQLATEFNKKLEEEKQLPVAPDRSRLKSDLKAMIAKAKALKTFVSIPSDKAADVAKTLKTKLEAAGVKTSALEDLEKKGKEIDTLYEKMTNYSTSYFAPIQMQDFDRLNIHFVSGKKKVNATPYRIYSKGGWKIDFSAGFSISNLNNKSYYYSDVTSETVVTGTNVVGGDTTITTREDKYGTIGLKKDAPDWSICTMAHLYPRTGLVFNPAIAFGAQISQDNVALLFGFSALFGREQRLALSGGVALGSATRLKAGYEVDDVVLDANAVKQGGVTFTQERRVAGAFASLTYNLGGITKSKK